MTAQEVELNDPQTLYRRWEESQWDPFSIDLSADRKQWTNLDESDRRLIHWVL